VDVAARRSPWLAVVAVISVACRGGEAPAPDAGPDVVAPADADAAGPDGGPGDFFGPAGAEASNALCANGRDDDQNGYADCDDNWCRDSVAVTACGALENTAAACADGMDNPETPAGPSRPQSDGLVDCADPDCAKSPTLVGVCPVLRFETGDAACRNGADDDGDGAADCDDVDCLHAGTTVCGVSHPRRRVLFDDAHRERAGSADWVVDTMAPHPHPSMPRAETDWAGELSSFGMELLQTGHFTVETLPASNGRLTFRDASNPQDLAQYAALVLPEPSAPLAADEAAALVAFVRAGGGVLFVVDHADSDRDGNGWDSVRVVNDVFQRAGGGDLAGNPFGFSVAAVSYDASGAIERSNAGVATTVPAAAGTHPVIAGPSGTVSRLGMHRGGLFTVASGPAGAGVAVLVHALPLGSAGYESGSPYVVAATLGAGRVVAVGDSAILNDGTDSHGIRDPSFDAWHAGAEHNRALFLNAIEWLAPAR
jgi:hypothetical protein